MPKPDFSTYLSTFSWRYSSPKMREIFSEKYKYEIWRRIWVALAEAEHEAGLVSQAELADLKKQQQNIEIERILEIEKETRHDVVAALKEFAEKAKIGGGKIHLGATSMDITDNTDLLRNQEALTLIEIQLKEVLLKFAIQIKQYADLATLGFTHLQPAEPTTVGYRLAVYGQDLLLDLQSLQFTLNTLQTKGMKGAVGTRASYQAVLANSNLTPAELDRRVMEKLGLNAALITTQVYPRKFDYQILTTLAGLGASAAKFAADLRILQSPPFGEWSEPFSKKQVGSSAMPFKKNPINAEKICSLARYTAQLPNIALENASHSYLERTLDDSANRRLILAEGCLATDEILITLNKLIDGLIINEKKIKHNLDQYAPFAAAESLIIEAVKQGANRQEMHEILREEAMKAWEAVQNGQPNLLADTLRQQPFLRRYLEEKTILKLLDISRHLGDAPQRARQLARKIEKAGRLKP